MIVLLIYPLADAFRVYHMPKVMDLGVQRTGIRDINNLRISLNKRRIAQKNGEL
jgi:hypothetical protein